MDIRKHAETCRNKQNIVDAGQVLQTTFSCSEIVQNYIIKLDMIIGTRRHNVKMREVNVAIADDNEENFDMLGEIAEQDHDLNLIGKANNGEDMYQSDQRKRTGM